MVVSEVEEDILLAGMLPHRRECHSIALGLARRPSPRFLCLLTERPACCLLEEAERLLAPEEEEEEEGQDPFLSFLWLVPVVAFSALVSVLVSVESVDPALHRQGWRRLV